MSEKIQTKEKTAEIEFEARQNLSGFFNLLFEIDIRNNPELYRKRFDEENDENKMSNFLKM